MSSISSQELAASASGSKEPECEPSRSVRSIRSAGASLPSTGHPSPAMMMSEMFPASAFGTTATPSASKSYVEGSRAKISAKPALAEALRAHAAAYGQSSPELLATFDHVSRLWKTSQSCLLAMTGDGWAEFSETWPRSGIMRSGIAYRLRPLVPDILATEFGSSAFYPTPRASGSSNAGGSNSRKAAIKRGTWISGRANPSHREWLMGFPVGWTRLDRQATPSFPKSLNSSDAQS